MYKVVKVSLIEGQRGYFFDANNFAVNEGDFVIVDTVRGIQFGVANSSVLDMDEKKIVFPLKTIVRMATASDIEKNKKNKEEEEKALNNAIKIAGDLGLVMRFIDASFTLDRTQLLFHYVAEDRVDFRELAKKLAQLYRTRIELRQIGIRDKAKEVGGIGPCGRPLCCNLFLAEFAPVSISMAKNQLLSLNPTKINGSCGRLLCCLNYEDEVYSELKSTLPSVGEFVKTPDGKGKVLEIFPLKGSYKVELINNRSVVEISVNEGN